MKTVGKNKAANRNIITCYIFNIFANIHFSFSLVIPFFLEWGSLSYTQIFFLQSWFLAWNFILEIPSGIFADHAGNKKSLVIGSAIGGIGLFIYGFSSGFTIYLLGSLLLAASSALISGAYDALLYSAVIENDQLSQNKIIFGKSHAYKMFALLIATPLGSYIASYTTINIPMILDACAITIACLVLLVAYKETSHLNKAEKQKKSSRTKIKEAMQFLIRHPESQPLFINIVIVSTLGYYFMWLFQPLLLELNVPLQYFGWFSMVLIALQALIASNFGLIEKYIPNTRWYLHCTIISSFLLFWLVFLVPSVVVALLFLMVGAHCIVQAKYTIAHLNEFIPEGKRATTLSIITALQSLIIIIINPFVGHQLTLAPLNGFLLVTVILGMIYGLNLFFQNRSN